MQKLRYGLLNLFFFSLLFGSYFLHGNSYALWRTEALALLALLFLASTFFFLCFRALKAEWVFDTLLLFLCADLAFGPFYPLYLFFKNLGHGSKPLAYALLFVTVSSMFAALIPLRSRISSIMRVLLMTTFFSTLAMYPWTNKTLLQISEAAPSVPASNKPSLFFIILDEHIGIEGIPTNFVKGARLKSALSKQYNQYGFTLFTRAYSNSCLTGNSIPGILNSTVVLDRKGTFENGVLLKNRLFEKLHQEGYRIHVYQSNFMDFARRASFAIDKSVTYDIYCLGLLQTTSLPVQDKLWVLGSNFAQWYHSQAMKKISDAFFRNRQSLLSPFAVELVFQEMASDIEKSPKGSAFFAHFLMPHFPYVYDDHGGIRKPTLWESDNCENCPKNVRNTPESRSRKYDVYINQVRHLHQELAALFAQSQRLGIFDHATYFLMSDHGSRITLAPMQSGLETTISAQDYLDAFASFVALKRGDAHRDFTTGETELPVPVMKITGELFSLATPEELSRPEVSKVYLASDPEETEKSGLDPDGKEMPAF